MLRDLNLRYHVHSTVKMKKSSQKIFRLTVSHLSTNCWLTVGQQSVKLLLFHLSTILKSFSRSQFTNYSFANYALWVIGRLLLAWLLVLLCWPKMIIRSLFCVQARIWEIGTKFTTKVWYVQSGDAGNKPILPFKQDQVDRYEQCDWQISIHFGQFLAT